jgi:gliding motility-associated-like protein
MKYFHFKFLLLTTFFISHAWETNAQLTINNTLYTPTQLINGVLVPAGSGVLVSNVVFSGVYNNSNRYQVGHFSTATTTLAQMGFSSGVVLSTGNTADIPLALGTDPQASQMSTNFVSCTAGEIRETGTCQTTINDLNILGGSSNYFNGAILEFDFIPVGTEVKFRYIFGSEEFSDNSGNINYQCSSYNDKFAFLISGPGISGGQGYTNDARNIARLANGSVVSINAVNNGIVGSSGGAPSAANCQTANPSWVQNSAVSEYLGTIDGTELNGNTKILTAQQTGLTAGSTYHMKLLIADINDGAYDAVVYIEANSLTTISCNIPQPTLNAPTQPTCSTSTGSFTITNYNPSYTYSASPSVGVVISGSTITAPAGNYTITATSGSCTNTASVTINPQPVTPPTPTFSAVTQPTCTTATGSFTITNYTSSFTYSSSPSSGITINSGSVTASPGNYTISATNGLCTSSASLTINAQPATQTPTFNQISGICPGGSFTLPPVSLQGISGTWSPPINNSTTTQYTFTPTSGACANTATMTVSVNSSVTPTFTPSGPYCQNAILTQVMLPSSSIEGITGTWNPGMISTANAGNIVHSFTTDAGQCATNTTMTIIVNAEVLSTFTQLEPVCEGGTFVLPSNSLEGIPGSWSPAMNNINSTPYTFTPDGGECATTASMTVSIISTVTPSFTQINPVCNLQSVTISNTSNNGITGSWSLTSSNASGGLFTFTPDAGQCATSTTMTVSLTSPQPQFTQIDPICTGESFTLPLTSNDGFTGTWSPLENLNATTNYTFTPGANQCAATTTMTVSVLSVSTPTFTNPGPLCLGDPLALPPTSNEGITGSWSPTINSTATTTYTFTPDPGQCATTSTLTVVVYPIPTAVFNPDVNQGCAPLTVNFTNMSAGSALCTWNFGNGVNIEDCSTVSYTFQQAGCYDISLTVTTQAGCSATTSVNDLICVSAIPIADFSASTYIIDEFHTLVDFENTSIGATNYEWLFGDSSSVSTIENASHDYAGNNLGNYLVTLVASSPQGCIDTAFATIIFQEQLVYYIPNAFTPDGNEFNQTFQPIFTSGIDPANFELFIYNRWGELIFETNDPNDGWDGSIGNGSNTALAPDGVYTWKVNIKLKNNDDRKTVVGHVNLMR